MISVGHTDKDIFQRFFNVAENKITVIPSGVDIKPLPDYWTKLEIRRQYAIPGDKIVVVFHGSYFHPPNKCAFDQIANYIAPETFKRNPNLLFLLIGTGVPHYDGINLLGLGFIDDLHSVFSASDMAIVPLSSGGGTKLKVLDYLGAGLPIISTNKGIEGLNIVPGQHSVIAKDAGPDFVRVILQLANDPELRNTLGNSARKLAEEEYDWKIIGESLNQLYGKI
ncbi:MAG: Spore coat protein SA [Firmicutes bacterium ADurb.Bin419]|nr:MAG: Spore coat protein SA [Firmicutes bacterium ADurb.Bin419]